jgi:hypothetical protein
MGVIQAYGVELGGPIAITCKKKLALDLYSAPGPEKLLFAVRSFSEDQIPNRNFGNRGK